MLILETIVTTRNPDGTAWIAPMGVRLVDGLWLLAPFRPSGTLENLEREGFAVMNLTDDVRVFAGCLTGRYAWPVAPAGRGLRLVDTLTHVELELERTEDDAERPRLYLSETARVAHAPFTGFNRAQAAVVELAILVSRVHMLPRERIDRELEYLRVAIEKTAGPRELEAWGWLLEALDGA